MWELVAGEDAEWEAQTLCMHYTANIIQSLVVTMI